MDLGEKQRHCPPCPLGRMPTHKCLTGQLQTSPGFLSPHPPPLPQLGKSESLSPPSFTASQLKEVLSPAQGPGRSTPLPQGLSLSMGASLPSPSPAPPAHVRTGPTPPPAPSHLHLFPASSAKLLESVSLPLSPTRASLPPSDPGASTLNSSWDPAPLLPGKVPPGIPVCHSADPGLPQGAGAGLISPISVFLLPLAAHTHPTNRDSPICLGCHHCSEPRLCAQ